MYRTSQKLIAELLGTFAVVLLSAGTVCARTASASSLGLFSVYAAYGLAYGMMCAATGHISGGHLNPAVTVGYWVTRRLNTFPALAYCLAQLAGATAAAYVLRYVVPEEIWRGAALGTPDLAGGLTRTPAMLIEGLMTFFLVFVVFATAIDERGILGRASGFAAGLTVLAGALFGGPFTGASMNPARAFGPALASRHWANHGVYWVGPLAGGVLAAWIYDSLFLRPTPPKTRKERLPISDGY